MKRRQPQVPLVAFTMDALRKLDDGPEPFVLPAAGRRVVEAATRALILSPQSREAKCDALKQVLAIAYVLETQHASPTAAREVTEAITSSPEVAEIVGIETRALRKRQRRLARFLGADMIRRAPVIDTAAPLGSMRLSSMLVANTRQYR